MISSECFTNEWISAKSKEYGYPDKNIIEKVIRAFSLLDMLAASGCPFHFKGGSCLMLLLTDQPYRLSIDIDIICPPGTGCNKVTAFNLNDKLTTICDSAFFNCNGDEAFANSGLKSLTLLDGDDLLEFGSNVFSYGLEELYFGRLTNTDVFKSKWSLKTVNVANTLTEIYPATFKGCDELETLRLGSALTTIGDEAFSGCKALKQVIVPQSVETIGEKAFANIPDLATIIMGHSVATIGAEAFDGASARDVYITAQVPPTAPNTTFSTYTGKLWLQDPGDESVMDAYYDAFTCWDRFDAQAMVVATSISVDRKDVNATPGAAVQLTATVAPDNASLPYVFWRSTNPDVATVDPNGVVTIVDADADGAESCTIIAETLYADGPVCEVTVNIDTAGIDDVVADNSSVNGEIDYSAPYDVYNLNGVKVASDSLKGLNHGFYIVRQGNVAKKIALN